MLYYALPERPMNGSQLLRVVVMSTTRCKKLLRVTVYVIGAAYHLSRLFYLK